MNIILGIIFGTLVTLAGIHGGRAAVERWHLGTLGALSLGWLLGMVFVLLLLGAALYARVLP